MLIAVDVASSWLQMSRNVASFLQQHFVDKSHHLNQQQMLGPCACLDMHANMGNAGLQLRCIFFPVLVPDVAAH
jgi:hypothetical protein